MKRSGKVCAALFAAVMALSMAACGSSDSSSKAQSTAAPQGSAQETSGTAADTAKPAEGSDTASATEKPAEGTEAPATEDPGRIETMMLHGGQLRSVPEEEGAEPVIRKIAITGNRAGSTEYNSAEPTDGATRCVFELNEYLDFYLDSDQTYDMKVWFFSHKDDQSYYFNNKCTDLTPGFAQVSDLYKDPDAEEGSSWASTYLNPSDCEAGLYDLVFTHSGKTVAAMLVKFYNEGELDKKSDDELRSICKEVYAEVPVY